MVAMKQFTQMMMWINHKANAAPLLSCANPYTTSIGICSLPTGKLRLLLSVCAPQYLSAGTSISPNERSKRNFPVGKEQMPIEVVYGFAQLKRGAALANHELGKISDAKKDAIVLVHPSIYLQVLQFHQMYHVQFLLTLQILPFIFTMFNCSISLFNLLGQSYYIYNTIAPVN